MADDIPTDLELLLEPGETALWQGRPHYPYFRSEAWAGFVFGLFPLAASALAWLMCYFVVRDIVTNARYQFELAHPITLISAVMFSLVAFECLSTPWTCRRQLARACYVVTDRRILMRDAPGYSRSGMIPDSGSKIYMFTPKDARARKIRRRHGRRVDLVFVTEQQNRSVVEIGILGAVDWEGAERTLRTAFGWDG